MARTNLTDSLLISRQVAATVRTGTIVQSGLDNSQVQVRVGASVITAGYLTNSYVPVVDDLVAVIKQDSSWLVLGTLPTSDATAWQPVPLNAGIITAGGGPDAMYRVIGSQVFFRGRIGLNPSAAIPNGQLFFTMPTDLRPLPLTVSQGWAVDRSSGGSPAPVPTTRVDCNTSGQFTLLDNVVSTTFARPTWIGLNQITYFIDS